MVRFQRKMFLSAVVLGLLPLVACAPGVQDRAKQSAAFSFEVYESLSDQVVAEIQGLVAGDEATITDADRERLGELNDLRLILDDYAAAHNLYVEALRTWESTENPPDDTISLESQMYRLIYRGIELAAELGLNVPSSLG